MLGCVIQFLSGDVQWEFQRVTYDICAQTAMNQLVWGDPDDAFASLMAEVNNVAAAVRADPRVAELNLTWVTCMVEAGHSGFYAPGGRLQQDMFFEYFSVYDRSEDQRTAFMQWELDVAVADWDCRLATNYDQLHRAIYHQIQQEFMEQHAAELEAWALHVNSAGR